MMNNKAFEDKVNEDIDQAKQDLATLGDDGVTGLNRIFEQLGDNAKETATLAVQTLNQSVGHGLSQYEAKVQEVADRIPGGFAKKAAAYPWVTITVSLAAGLLIGLLLRPGRQPLG
jgi:ElaB/YqjD/DUF883 family membrane-anchored ribosome-binding protein